MGLVLDVFTVLLIGLVAAVTMRLLVCGPVIWNWMSDEGLPALRRRVRGRRFEEPVGRPIEEIARSLRRLGGTYYGGHPGRSWVKSEGLRRSYDDALAEGCRSLELDSDLLDLEPGTERDAERMRVEHLLTTAGLILHRAA